MLQARILPDLLDHAVATHGSRPALDFEGRSWTYAQLGQLVARAAHGLAARGLERGERIALCLPNLPYYPVLYFAALRLGAVVVNLNPLYTERELEQLLRDSEARMIAVPDLAELHGKVRKVAEALDLDTVLVCPLGGVLPLAKALGWRWLRRADHAQVPADARHLGFAQLIANRGTPPARTVAPEDLAVLQYTGGTTGLPKAAMLTHANLVANSRQQYEHDPEVIPGHERLVAVLPFFHVFALTAVLNFGVMIGGELLLFPRFAMDAFLKTLARKPPTIMHAVPTLFIALNALPPARRPRLTTLKGCFSGGAPLPGEVAHAFHETYAVPICQGYGLTEASPVVTCSPVGQPSPAGSSGVAMRDTVIEIRNPDHPEELLPIGTDGEICVRGPQVMAGYWHRPEDTERSFVDGALRTGDVGHLDAQGFLYIVDRIKDLILCGGYNVYPRVIEDAAYEHPAVEEAIAIGVPDPYRGQAPKLFVKCRAGTSVSAAELLTFLGGQLNRIEIPREIEFRDALPKSAVGKLLRRALVEEENTRRAANPTTARPAAGVAAA